MIVIKRVEKTEREAQEETDRQRELREIPRGRRAKQTTLLAVLHTSGKIQATTSKQNRRDVLMATIPQEEKLVEYVRKRSKSATKCHIRNSYGCKNLSRELVYTFCGRVDGIVTWYVPQSTRNQWVRFVGCLINTQHYEWIQIRDNVGYDAI